MIKLLHNTIGEIDCKIKRFFADLALKVRRTWSINKIIRCFIAVLVFMCLTLNGAFPTREAQQLYFIIAGMVLFGLMLNNVWATLFLTWTAYLYAFYGFKCGQIYVSHIFIGSVLYLLTKISFQKKHIDFFINAVLWLIVLNIGYMIVQCLEWDFIYKGIEHNTGATFRNIRPLGFMGNYGYTGILIAIGIPLLATRGHKWSIPLAITLFLPLSLAKSCLPILGGVIGLLFVLFFKIPRKVWVVFVLVFIILSACYLIFIDMPGTERWPVWKTALEHVTMSRPLVGLGLDSFRNALPWKNFKYINPGGSLWDNPHNLYISIYYEFGLIGLMILIGYLRFLGLRFGRAIKSPNTLALGGVILLFFIVSLGHFPIFLSRLAVIFVPIMALFENSTT